MQLKFKKKISDITNNIFMNKFTQYGIKKHYRSELNIDSTPFASFNYNFGELNPLFY